MFEKFLYSNMVGSKPGYSELIQRPETKVVQVLDEETFVNDFKTGSQRLKNFMTYQRFVQLTQLVTVVGPEAQKKRSYKFPLIAYEMLSSENTKIQQYFLPSTGVVIIEQKIIKSVQKMVEQEIDDDDDQEQSEQNQEEKSAQKIPQNNIQNEARQIEKNQTEAQKTQEDAQQFGQFVQAPPKPKKKIMVKEVVDTVQIINKQCPALINLLLNYFSNPINHTLTGYVCKILLNFTNKKTAAIFSRLFDNPSVTDNIFDHVFTQIGSRSTVQWLVRLLTIENRTYVAERYQILNKLLQLMRNAEGVEDLSNISACFCQTFDKLNAHFKTTNTIKQLQIFIRKIPQLLAKTTELVLSDREDVSTYSAQVFAYLLTLLPSNDELNDFPELVADYLPGTANKLKFILSQQRSKLGLFSIKVLQTYNSALRSKSVNQWLKESKNNVLPTLFGLVKKYLFNNIFHNEVFKFIQNCITSTITQLSSFVLNQSGLLEWLEQEAQFQQARVKGPKKGYAQHIVNLCKFLRQQARRNVNAQKFIKNESFTNVWNVLVEKQVISAQRLLGGYSKKQTVHKIMHSKEKILTAYATFLASTPPPVLQIDPQDPLQNQQLLKQLQRQLDGIEQEAEPRTVQVIAQQQHKAGLIEQNQQHKSAFWKVHLDYDIDNLIDQLV